MKGLLWMVKNWQMSLLAVALICSMGLGVYFKGRSDERHVWVAKINAQKAETINDNLRIKEKSDNIIRPSDVDLINRLREGTF